MDDHPAAAKRALRAEIRQRRRSHGEQRARAAGEGFAVQLRELVAEHGARSVACYLSGEFEPNTRPFLNWAFDAGIRTLLPVTRDDGLLDWVVSDRESERMHDLGFPEATGELLGPIAIDDVDLILIPAAAVDARGLRLGWGRGYYDKTLGSMTTRPPVYAVVHDEEIVDRVPSETHDQGVDGAVTPTRIVRFGHG